MVRGRTIVIAVFCIAAIIIAALFFTYVNRPIPPMPTGENENRNKDPQPVWTEIKHYPLNELSFTVTDWTLTKEGHQHIFGVDSLEPKNGNVYVIVNFTFRNIGDMEINILNNENFWKLAEITTPLLEYGDYYAQAYPRNFCSGAGLYWYQPTDLMPNQTTQGGLLYEILEGYTPSSLLYPNKDSPTFVITLCCFA